MLGLKPNRITGSDDTITPPIQTVNLPHQSTDEIELPSVEKEDIEEIPRTPSIPGEDYDDIFNTIDQQPEEACPCKKPNKLFGKFDDQQYEEDEDKPSTDSSKYSLIYLGMGLSLLKYLI